MEKLIVLFCLVTFQIPNTTPQCLNRQPQNLVFNRQIPETIIEAPLHPPLTFQKTVFETPNILPSASTIITDCTPAVCQNLVNTLQLMIVCNLLKNSKDGSELAAHLASPVIGEALASQAFSCGCTDRRYLNGFPLGINVPHSYPGMINPNIISGAPVFPGAGFANIISEAPVSRGAGFANIISGAPVSPGAGFANVNNNALIGNILGMLGN